MDLHATAKHYQEGINHPKHPHKVMALRGRFKNEACELEHLKPLAVETKSGLKVGVWFKRMLSWYEARGVTRGPVFWDSRGNRAQPGCFELAILTELDWLQKLTDGLISPNVDVFEDFGVSRLFWQGSCSQAVNRGVSQPSINLDNRWSSDKRLKGKKMSLNMFAHYTDIRLVIGRYLEYLEALQREVAWKDHTLRFVLGTPLRGMLGTGDGKLLVCKIPGRQKFNCSVSD
jgi:hypothetical protein